MGAKGNSFITDLLNHIFTNATIPNLGDATGVRGSTTAGSLFVSLHTADPGASGSQTTSEAAYTGYARVAVARSGSGWTVTGQSVSPVSDITFGACTAGSETETFIGIGSASSGTGELLYRAALSPTIVVANGVTPIVKATTAITEA